MQIVWPTISSQMFNEYRDRYEERRRSFGERAALLKGTLQEQTENARKGLIGNIIILIGTCLVYVILHSYARDFISRRADFICALLYFSISVFIVIRSFMAATKIEATKNQLRNINTETTCCLSEFYLYHNEADFNKLQRIFTEVEFLRGSASDVEITEVTYDKKEKVLCLIGKGCRFSWDLSFIEKIDQYITDKYAEYYFTKDTADLAFLDSCAYFITQG